MKCEKCFKITATSKTDFTMFSCGINFALETSLFELNCSQDTCSCFYRLNGKVWKVLNGDFIERITRYMARNNANIKISIESIWYL